MLQIGDWRVLIAYLGLLPICCAKPPLTPPLPRRRVLRILRVSERNLRQDLQTKGFQGDEFAGVVGQNAHGMDVQGSQDLRADSIFALLAAQSDRLIGVHAMLA